MDGRAIIQGNPASICSTTKCSERHFVNAYEFGKLPRILLEKKKTLGTWLVNSKCDNLLQKPTLWISFQQKVRPTFPYFGLFYGDRLAADTLFQITLFLPNGSKKSTRAQTPVK